MKITENHIAEATSFFSSSQGILQIGEQTYSKPICWQGGKISIIPQATIEELNEQIFVSALTDSADINTYYIYLQPIQNGYTKSLYITAAGTIYECKTVSEAQSKSSSCTMINK